MLIESINRLISCLRVKKLYLNLETHTCEINQCEYFSKKSLSGSQAADGDLEKGLEMTEKTQMKNTHSCLFLSGFTLTHFCLFFSGEIECFHLFRPQNIK